MMKKSDKVIFVIILLCLFVGVLRISNDGFIFNYRPVIALSGSMEPEIPTYSLFIEKKNNNQEPFKKGDIISFKVNIDGEVLRITHRIVDVKNGFYITKGDANDSIDYWKIKASQIEGKVVFIFKYFIYFLVFCVAIIVNLIFFKKRSVKHNKQS